MPEALDPDIVLAAASAVHADGDSVLRERPFPFRIGVLHALVGIDDFRGCHAAGCIPPPAQYSWSQTACCSGAIRRYTGCAHLLRHRDT